MHELHARIEAEDLGHDRAPQRERERRVEVVAEHVREAQQRDVDVRAVVGEVAEERLDLEQRALDVAWSAGPVRVMSSRKKYGSALVAPYTRPELFSTTLRTGLPDAPAAASRFIVPITLISCSVRLARARRVDDEVRVHDRVDLGRGDDAGEDRVRRVGAHELGALERDPRIVRVDADDDLDVGPLLELLRDAAAPVRRQAR